MVSFGSPTGYFPDHRTPSTLGPLDGPDLVWGDSYFSSIHIFLQYVSDLFFYKFPVNCAGRPPLQTSYLLHLFHIPSDRSACVFACHLFRPVHIPVRAHDPDEAMPWRFNIVLRMY